MPTLTPNIENRVRKLPKPSNASQGLQPLFEAVSNAFYAIEDFRGSDHVADGTVAVVIDKLNDPATIEIVVTDDGIGLDEERYGAFCEIDTPFKRDRGGKGVGRLFWLDAFRSIGVTSSYAGSGSIEQRAFSFDLNNDVQVVPAPATPVEKANPGTTVRFRGLRGEYYEKYFPKRLDTFLRYFSAHFIADFLVGNCPQVVVTIDGKGTSYPYAVTELVVGDAMRTGPFETEEFGTLEIVGYTCRKEASTGLEGSHQLHLLANGRTVETRKIDNLLALAGFERNGEEDLVFHGCVSGEFLDERVNEGRTAFNVPEKQLKQLSRQCTEVVKKLLLPDQVNVYRKQRKANYQMFVSRYPIYGFDDPEVQLDRVPFHANEPEEFAAGLVKHQIRRDERRDRSLERIIEDLDQNTLGEDFAGKVAEAATAVHTSEQLALAHHVVRRKLVLELLDRLLKRVRSRSDRDDDYVLEKTVHSFICPMGVRGDENDELHGRAHDLWIVDERLAFTRAFSSDKRLDQLLKDGGGAQRPDLIVWDLAYGMGVTNPAIDPEAVDVSEPLRKVLVVEFKKPGRQHYKKAEDQIEQQITKYLSQLKNGEIETFDRERVRIADDCIFHCYVVADIVGDLELQLSSWRTTANGEGRVRPLENEYRGTIEVVQWRDLVNDAWARNQATLHAAGLLRT